MLNRLHEESRIYFTQQLNTLPCLPSNFVENIKMIFDRFCARGKGHCEWYLRLPAYHKSVSRGVSIRSHLAVDPASIEIFSQPWPVTLNRLPAFLPRICLIDQPIRTVECYSVSAFPLSSLPSTRAVPVWSPSGMPNCPRNLPIHCKTCFGFPADWSPKMIRGENASVLQPPTSRQ